MEIAGEAGAHTVELSLDRSDVANAFARSIRGPATATVPQFVAELPSQVA